MNTDLRYKAGLTVRRDFNTVAQLVLQNLITPGNIKGALAEGQLQEALQTAGLQETSPNELANQDFPRLVAAIKGQIVVPNTASPTELLINTLLFNKERATGNVTQETLQGYALEALSYEHTHYAPFLLHRSGLTGVAVTAGLYSTENDSKETITNVAKSIGEEAYKHYQETQTHIDEVISLSGSVATNMDYINFSNQAGYNYAKDLLIRVDEVIKNPEAETVYFGRFKESSNVDYSTYLHNVLDLAATLKRKTHGEARVTIGTNDNPRSSAELKQRIMEELGEHWSFQDFFKAQIN